MSHKVFQKYLELIFSKFLVMTLYLGVLWVHESSVSYRSTLDISLGTLRSKSAKFLLGKTFPFYWDKKNKDIPGIVVFVGMYNVLCFITYAFINSLQILQTKILR